jgi:hypothetical protein
MKIIDVLGDGMAHLALRGKPGDRLMATAGLTSPIVSRIMNYSEDRKSANRSA